MLLEVRHLSIAYGDAPAVWDATLQVEAGEIVSVIGPNGAGKSTLVNAIAGLHGARSGERLDGVDLNAHRRPGVGHRPGARGAGCSADVGGGESRDGLLPEARRAAGTPWTACASSFDPARAAAAARRLALEQPATDGGHRPQSHSAPPAAIDEPSLGHLTAPTMSVIRAIHAEGVASCSWSRMSQAGHRRPRYMCRGGRVVADGQPSILRQQSRISRRILACATGDSAVEGGRR